LIEQRAKKIHLFKKPQTEQFEFLSLLVKKNTNNLTELVGFEHSHIFKSYQTHNNLDVVLSRLSDRHDSHEKLLNYLMFPNLFVDRYRNRFRIKLEPHTRKKSV
jgi:hypothetical protein